MVDSIFRKFITGEYNLDNLDNLTSEELEQFNALVDKASKPKNKVWKPKAGECEDYWYVNHNGSICQGIFSCSPEHTERFSFGNCFKTEEEAEFALERLKVIAEMKRYIAEHDDVELDWDNRSQQRFSLFFDYYNKSVDYVENRRCKFNDFCTSRSDILLDMIKEIGENRIKKYYFGLD